jgi:hypothetical protein
MKIAVLVLLVFLTANVFGQIDKDLQILAETEKSFARFAAEKDTKSAFLEFAAPDGTVFQPNPTNAIAYWKARGASKGLLSWTPAFADVSANKMLGWTTGPWEYYPKGKTDAPTAFGDFATIWQRQPDGKYKFVLDIGVSHEKSQVDGVDWKSPADAGKTSGEQKLSAGETASEFYQIANNLQLYKAYKTYAADDVRVLREGKLPSLGKENFLRDIKKDKTNVFFTKRNTFFYASDTAYTFNTYVLTRADKTTEKGNFLQIWKLRAGKWQIVLDVFNPIPEK